MIVLVVGCDKENYSDIEQDDILLDENFEIETRSVVKYTLCHFNQESSSYDKLSLPENAVNNHLSNHDMDRLPDQTVTINGVLYLLDNDCVLVLAPPTDGCGNTYGTVVLGNQEWLTENLKTTKYNDGTPIPLVEDNGLWGSLTTPAYSWYNNDQISNEEIYGAIYNYYAVADTNTRNVCPIGWHVPTHADWQELVNSLGGAGIAGGAMKEVGLTYWDSPNTGATNSSGFSARAGGNRNTSGVFDQFGHGGFWWSSTEFNADRSFYWWVQSNANDAYTDNNLKDIGFSIRCVKD